MDNTQWATSQLSGTLHTTPFTYRFLFKEDKYIYDQFQIDFNKFNQRYPEISYFAGYIKNELQQFQGYIGDKSYFFSLDDSYWIKNITFFGSLGGYGIGCYGIKVCFMNFSQSTSCQAYQYLASQEPAANITSEYKIDDTHYYDLVGFYGKYFIDELHIPIGTVYNAALIQLIINSKIII